MIGSEKQIIWATELKAAVTETIKEFTAYATKIGAPAEVIATWTARVDKLAACDIAGAIIDQFQGFYRTGELQKDAVSLNSKYKVGSNQYEYKFS